jgi:hypothetical protein
VSAVELYDDLVNTSKRGEVTVQPASNLIWRYSGESSVGILVGIFTTKIEGAVAAHALADKMKVPLKLTADAGGRFYHEH